MLLALCEITVASSKIVFGLPSMSIDVDDVVELSSVLSLRECRELVESLSIDFCSSSLVGGDSGKFGILYIKLNDKSSGVSVNRNIKKIQIYCNTKFEIQIIPCNIESIACLYNVERSVINTLSSGRSGRQYATNS